MKPFDGFTAVLDYPMYVVTVAVGAERAGCLVGFASQCSIEPPRFMVWLSKENHTYQAAARAGFLGVHLLTVDQQPLAALFGSRTADDGTDKFAAVGWHTGPGGVPVLHGVAAWFVGRIVQRIEGGDHTGFLLAPVAGEASTSTPGHHLMFSGVRELPPGHPVSG